MRSPHRHVELAVGPERDAGAEVAWRVIPRLRLEDLLHLGELVVSSFPRDQRGGARFAVVAGVGFGSQID